MLRSSVVANAIAKSVENGNGRHSVDVISDGHMPQAKERTKIFEEQDQLVAAPEISLT
jgi:hypothetical protein